jgi:hypothetical protein
MGSDKFLAPGWKNGGADSFVELSTDCKQYTGNLTEVTYSRAASVA